MTSHQVGTEEEEEILLQDYMSYDEMQLAALLGVSSHTYFINLGTHSTSRPL